MVIVWRELIKLKLQMGQWMSNLLHMPSDKLGISEEWSMHAFSRSFVKGVEREYSRVFFYSEILKQLQLKTVSYFYLKFYHLENWFTVVLEFKLVDMFKLRKI